MFLADGKKRKTIEQFIQAGYNKAYQADISVTMPALLYIEDKHLKAALGMRGSNERFFVEQYLTQPLLLLIQQQFPQASRKDIIEIGSLYSNSNRFTIPLFLVTAVTAYLLGKRFMVLCGTEHVLSLLTKSGVDYFQLADADQALLLPSDDDWGSYYATNPQVVYVSLDNIMSLIENNKFYHKLFYRLSHKISLTCEKMAGKL